MNFARLKHATAAEHTRMESLVPLMSATLHQDQYRVVLRRFYEFVHSWEVWSAANAPEDLRPMLLERRRSRLLEADLRYFGEQLPEFHYTPPIQGTPSRAVFLGAMYVIEGSTLGGQYIAGHVEKALGLLPGQGDSYFRGHGDRTGSMWRQFRMVIEEAHDDEAEDVIAGAREMFAAFGEWMRQLKPADSLENETMGAK